MLNRMTHILVECPELIASVRVGVLNALLPLEQRRICEVIFRETRKITKDDLVWCDIFICVRGSEYMTLDIVREAKRLGRFVLFFLDDDLLHLPKESLAYDYFHFGKHQIALKKILLLVDGLWGANELIRADYLPLCSSKRWIITRMPMERRAVNRQKMNTKVKVLYAGSVDHQNIVRAILSPAVQIVNTVLEDQVDFTFVGPDPNLREVANVHHQPFFEDYNQYQEFVKNGSFDIGLAPTNLDSFFQHKYYNKFVEYTSIGAVGIYTDCPLYRQIVVHEHNGLLTGNSPEEWANAIVMLVSQTSLRKQCLREADVILTTDFLPEQVAQKLLQQVPEINEFRAPMIKKECINLHMPAIYFYLDRITYLICRYRFYAVILIIQKTLKKLFKWLRRRIQ